jgi:WD40 repeat protein
MDTSSKPTFNPNELSTSQPHDKKRILQFLFVFLGIILIILGLAFWRYVFINRFTTQKPQTSQHESQEIPKEPKEEMNLTSTKLGAFTGPVSRLVSRNVPVLFSKKGDKVAYIIEENRKSSVVINGLTGKAYDQIDDLKISPDGDNVAYIVKDGEYYYVVENAKLSTPYDHIDDLMYSPDGRILKYNAQKEKKEFVVMNGVEGDKYPGISDFIISPDSKRYAYVALDDELKPYVVVDGKKIHPKNPGEAPTLNDLTFSPDSLHFAYSLSTYINGKSIAYVNVDLKDKKEYDSVREFAFSPDSRHFAYIANLGNVNVDIYTIPKEFVVYDEDELYSPDKQNISFILPGRYSLLHQFPEEPVYPLPISFSPLTQSVTYLAFEKHGQYTSFMTQVRDVLHYNFYGLFLTSFDNQI